MANHRWSGQVEAGSGPNVAVGEPAPSRRTLKPVPSTNGESYLIIIEADRLGQRDHPATRLFDQAPSED